MRLGDVHAGRGLRRTALAAAAVIMALTLVWTPAAHAEEGDQFRPQTMDLMAPIRDKISGSAWAWEMGYAPRSQPMPSGQAVGRLSSAIESPASQGGGGALVPFRDPAPSFSRNVLLTRDFSKARLQTEPHIAVDPKDSRHLVAGMIDYAFPNISVYTSFDSGETWEGPFQTPFIRDDVGGGGDPVIAFDREGNVHAAFISIGIEDFTIGTITSDTEVSSIGISRSSDGGITWSEPVSTARSAVVTNLTLGADQKTRGSISASFLDKPWISIGPDPANPARDVMYIAYVDFDVRATVLYIDELPTLALSEVQSTIKMVASRDGGRTWTSPVNVSPTVREASGVSPSPGTGDIVGLKRVVQGAMPQALPDGTLVVAWFDSTDDESQKGLGEFYIARSADGGRTFTRPQRIAVVRELGFTSRRANFRYWGGMFPRLAAGPNNEIYLVYAALNAPKPIDDGDIFFMRSMDKGTTWSEPVVLGGDRTAALQFYPAIAVDPKGALHVMWGDMRDSKEQTKYHIYYTTSSDQGRTWGFESKELGFRSEDTRVSDFPSNPNFGFPGGRFIGDYFAIAASGEDVYMVWADTRLGEFGGGPNQKIGFARRKAIASPEVFISPPSGPAGQQVTLQGFNLQPDLIVFIQVAGVTIAAERTNLDGRFKTRFYMPVSGQGAQDIRVLDESGNSATTSFFTEFGFGDIRTKQDALSKTVSEISGGNVAEELAKLRAQVAESRGGTAWWVILLATLGGATIAAAAASAMTLRWYGRRSGGAGR